MAPRAPRRLVDHPIDVGGGEAGADLPLDHIEQLAREVAGRPHLLDLVRPEGTRFGAAFVLPLALLARHTSSEDSPRVRVGQPCPCPKAGHRPAGADAPRLYAVHRARAAVAGRGAVG
jgi:hypothetical protein